MLDEDKAVKPQQDEDRFKAGLATAWCTLGFVFPLVIGIMGALDWGLTSLPEKPAFHRPADEPRLSNVLIGIVDGLAMIHVACALIAFHAVRRQQFLVLGISVFQLMLTGYLWYVARTAFAVGGWTWNPMNG